MEHVSGIVQRLVTAGARYRAVEDISVVGGHEFKDDVDRFMDHLKKAISLRVEAQVRQFHEDYDELRKESDKMVRDAEYMVYEMIDNAMEEGALHVRESEV